MTTSNPYKTVNIDPDDIEAIDKFIDELVLSGDKIKIESAYGTAKTTLGLIVWTKVLTRCKERNLYAQQHVAKGIPSLKANMMKYTGDVIQQEVIKQWMPDRHFHFCYDKASKEDHLFCPGLPSSITARPGEYIGLTTAGGFFSCTEKSYKENWIPIGDEECQGTPEQK